MKKCLFSALFFICMAGLASAQSTSGNTNARSVSNTSHTKHATKVASKTKKSVATKNSVKTTTAPNSTATAPIPNNRVEYMQNGQLATVTGHQATPVNSDEYQSGRGKKKKKNTDKTRY